MGGFVHGVCLLVDELRLTGASRASGSLRAPPGLDEVAAVAASALAAAHSRRAALLTHRPRRRFFGPSYNQRRRP